MTNRKRVRVEPGIFKLKKDLYEVRVRVTHPETKERRAKYQTVHGTLQMARESRALLREELAAPERPEVIPRTLGDYASSWLSTSIARGDLARSTAGKYASVLDLHILPEFGRMELRALTPRAVDAWLGRRYSQGSFAAATVNTWLRLLSSLMSAAVRDGLIDKNVVAHVRPLKQRQTDDGDNSLTPEELRSYLFAWRAVDAEDYALVVTLAATGMRWGEATALTWADVDAAERTGALVVRRCHVRGDLKEPKTNRARRVPMSQALVAVLREHRQHLVARQAPGLSAGWVFPSSNGKLRANGSLSLKHRQVLRDIGVQRRVTIHGLRHTMTDLLRMAAVDPVAATAIIGHTTARMRQHYSHIGAGETRDIGDLVLQAAGLSAESLIQKG
ncbi:MAG: site-specific integrase [Myxococcales bacterium]|nr:site-specific integrase [Myxococcales bacterium]MCB9628162.1 site-specific integrase [Sandaracinaceae bacterium]